MGEECRLYTMMGQCDRARLENLCYCLCVCFRGLNFELLGSYRRPTGGIFTRRGIQREKRRRFLSIHHVGSLFFFIVSVCGSVLLIHTHMHCSIYESDNK